MKTLRAYLRQPRHFELVEEDLYPNDDTTLIFMTHVIESIDHEDTIKIKNAFYSCV